MLIAPWQIHIIRYWWTSASDPAISISENDFPNVVQSFQISRYGSSLSWVILGQEENRWRFHVFSLVFPLKQRRGGSSQNQKRPHLSNVEFSIVITDFKTNKPLFSLYFFLHAIHALVSDYWTVLVGLVPRKLLFVFPLWSDRALWYAAGKVPSLQ